MILSTLTLLPTFALPPCLRVQRLSHRYASPPPPEYQPACTPHEPRSCSLSAVSSS